MTPALSTYLNILRVFAALEVFLGHLCIWGRSCGAADRLPTSGADGVVTFFVLSGYVVAYAADTKDKTARSFAINRCARIYSVALPALLLTIALECIGIQHFPDAYNAAFDRYQIGRLWLYVPLWLSFSSEFWHVNEPMLTNSPFWSLCFEVWFYIFFAASLFMRGRARVAALLGIALLVGPKICLLFPLWWLGVLAYRAQRRMTLTPTQARALLLSSLGAYVLIKGFAADTGATERVDAALGHMPVNSLQMAWQLPGFLMLALCVAGSILAVRFAALNALARLAAPVGIAASFTFTIYLVHLPALKFFVALGGGTVGSMLWPALLTLPLVVALGLLTERRIAPWRAGFALALRLGDRIVGETLAMARRRSPG